MKKTVTIAIDIAELLYEIANETYLRHRSLKTDENYKQATHIYATADEEERAKILQSIDKSYAEICTELGEYYTGDSYTEDNMNIILVLPNNYNDAATVDVAESIKAFLRSYAIMEWYIIVNKDEAKDYQVLCEKAKLQLRKALYRRKRPNRDNI